MRIRPVRFKSVRRNRTDIFAVFNGKANKIITLVIAVDNSTIDKVIGHLDLVDLLLTFNEDNNAGNDTERDDTGNKPGIISQR